MFRTYVGMSCGIRGVDPASNPLILNRCDPIQQSMHKGNSDMLWSIRCVDKPNSTDLRMSLRPDHLAYLNDHNAMIVLAGASLTDDGDIMTGSVFVVSAKNRQAVEAFSAGDPFTKAGLFADVAITRMRKGVWNPESMPEA